VTNHIGAKGDQIESYKKLGVLGIVLAGTGGGTVHQDLALSLEDFMKDGGALVRSSRVGLGVIPGQLANGRLDASIGAGDLNPPKARIALQLALFASLHAKANALSWQDIFARIEVLPNSR
jgi:L-asparaginase